MSKQEAIKQRLLGIFRQVFDDDELEISTTTTAADIEDWDSLSHITLIVACEKEFGLKLSPKEIGDLKNVGEMLVLLEQRATR
jgi:acyl carrier protein